MEFVQWEAVLLIQTCKNSHFFQVLFPWFVSVMYESVVSPLNTELVWCLSSPCQRPLFLLCSAWIILFPFFYDHFDHIFEDLIMRTPKQMNWFQEIHSTYPLPSWVWLILFQCSELYANYANSVLQSFSCYASFPVNHDLCVWRFEGEDCILRIHPAPLEASRRLSAFDFLFLVEIFRVLNMHWLFVLPSGVEERSAHSNACPAGLSGTLVSVIVSDPWVSSSISIFITWAELVQNKNNSYHS